MGDLPTTISWTSYGASLHSRYTLHSLSLELMAGRWYCVCICGHRPDPVLPRRFVILPLAELCSAAMHSMNLRTPGGLWGFWWYLPTNAR